MNPGSITKQSADEIGRSNAVEIKCGCCFLQIIVYTTSAMSPLKILQLQVVPV